MAINVLETGHYDVSGDLYSGSGEKLADGVYTTILAGEPLATGAHTVTLSFDGKTLREAGVDGPYVLDHLDLQHHSAEFDFPMTVASARSVYTTTAYAASQFEGDAVRVIATGERAEDLTGDGLYESLSITATLDVQQPGLYEWHGFLVDAAGAPIAQTSQRGQLGALQPALFTFTGEQIRTADLDGLYDALVISATVAAVASEGDYTWSGQLAGPNGALLATAAAAGQLYQGKVLTFAFMSPVLHNANVDGPYTLQNVVISSETDSALAISIPFAYTTTALPATLFDTWDFQFSGVGAQVIDIDENGLYDKLAFTSTVDIEWAGDYTLETALVAQVSPTTMIDPGVWYAWFEPGQEQDVTLFSGPTINNAGFDGPFRLRVVRVTYYVSDAIPSATVVDSQDVFTTDTYLVNQFQPYPVIPLAAPVPAQPVNEDGDGAYTVTWTPPISQTVTYKLRERRSANHSPTYFIESIIYSGEATSIAVADRAGGYTYCYAVRAKRNLRTSNWSEEACVVIPIPTPPGSGGGSIGGG